MSDPKLSDEEIVRLQVEGFEILSLWSRNIAMLPLEEWLEGLNKAESIAPILNPTLYRDYAYSEKAKILKELVEASIPLKAVVLKANKLHEEGKL